MPVDLLAPTAEQDTRDLLASQPAVEQGKVNIDEGAPASVRAQASFFSSPEEKYKFFERTFQPKNVRRGQGGETEFKHPERGWSRVDEEGLSLADLADWVGDIPEIAGTTIGGLVGTAGMGAGSVPGAATGGALGNILKQMIAARFGEQRGLGERALDTGISAAVGGAGQKIANIAGPMLRSINIPKARRTAYAQEGIDAAKEVGGKLTLSQEVGSRGARIVEDQTRRNAMAADILEQFELNEQVAPAKAYLERVMNKLTPSNATDLDVGRALDQGYKRVVDAVTKAAQNPATRDQGIMAIKRLQNSVLEARLGKPIPKESIERHADWLKRLKPEELKFTLGILQHTQPNIREVVMRNFLQDSIEDATKAAQHMQIPGAMRPEYSMSELLKKLPDQRIIDSVLGAGSATKKEIGQLMIFLSRALQRSPGTLTLQQTPAGALAAGGAALANLPLVAFLHRLTARLLISPQLREQARIVAKTAGRPFTAPASFAAQTLEKWLPALIQEIQQEINDEGA